MAVQQWQSGNLLSGSMNPSSALGVAANASGNMFTQLTQAQQIADIEREREWRRNELKRADARRSEIAGQADKLFNEEDLAAQARINAMGSDALLSEIGQGNWQVGENPGMLLYSNNDNLQAGFRDRGERETAADYIKAQRAAAFAPGTDFSDGITEFRGRGERETAEDYLKAMRGPAAAERLAKQTARDSRIMDSRTATDEILAGKKDEILARGREKLLSDKRLYLDGNAIEGRMRDTMTNMGYTDQEIQDSINPKLDPIFGRNDPTLAAEQIKGINDQKSPMETFVGDYLRASKGGTGSGADGGPEDADIMKSVNFVNDWMKSKGFRSGSRGILSFNLGSHDIYEDDVHKYVADLGTQGITPAQAVAALEGMTRKKMVKSFNIGDMTPAQVEEMAAVAKGYSANGAGSDGVALNGAPDYNTVVQQQFAWENNKQKLISDINRLTGRQVLSDEKRNALLTEDSSLNQSGFSRVDKSVDAALNGINDIPASDFTEQENANNARGNSLLSNVVVDDPREESGTAAGLEVTPDEILEITNMAAAGDERAVDALTAINASNLHPNFKPDGIFGDPTPEKSAQNRANFAAQKQKAEDAANKKKVDAAMSLAKALDAEGPTTLGQKDIKQVGKDIGMSDAEIDAVRRAWRDSGGSISLEDTFNEYLNKPEPLISEVPGVGAIPYQPAVGAGNKLLGGTEQRPQPAPTNDSLLSPMGQSSEVGPPTLPELSQVLGLDENDTMMLIRSVANSFKAKPEVVAAIIFEASQKGIRDQKGLTDFIKLRLA